MTPRGGWHSTRQALSLCASVITTVVAIPAANAQGRLTGVVYDSVTAGPLPSALVQMALVSDPSVSRSVRADAAGRFRLDSVPAGTWVAVVMHPRLDSLGIEQLARSVTTGARGEQRITLAVPSASTLVRQVCGELPATDSVGFLHGRVRALSGMTAGVPTGVPTGAPALENATVDVQWVDLALDLTRGVGVQRIPRRVSAPVRDDGTYTVCGMPPGGTVRVRGIRGNDSTGVVEVVMAEHGITRSDLAVGPVLHVAVQESSADSASFAEDSVPLTRWRRTGSGQLQGLVLGPGNVPLPNATVIVRGVDITARSDDAGRWQLRQLPQGTHTVELRALGYRAEQLVVDIGDPAVPVLQTALDRVVALDTVRTRALRETMFVPELRAFDQRRKQYSGYFRGPAELDQIMPFEAADIFRSMPGIRVSNTREGTSILLRGKAGAPCVPDIFLDRMRVLPDMSRGMIDDWVYARSIRAVEVYMGVSMPPPEFVRAFNDCGVIVIWTGRN